MKSAYKLLSMLALTLIVSAVACPVRAEDSSEYPRQFSTDARRIYSSHMLNTYVPYETPRIDTVINFDTNSSKLTPAAQAQVHKLAVWIKHPRFHGTHVVVNGYTDSVGKNTHNQGLSYHRAQNVMHALIADGVPASMLSAQGFGEADPVDSNSTAEGRAANRRATFSVVCPN
jgi:outer membrane protein OmpA-like peptidoglycan-associated protein